MITLSVKREATDFSIFCSLHMPLASLLIQVCFHLFLMNIPVNNPISMSLWNHVKMNPAEVSVSPCSACKGANTGFIFIAFSFFFCERVSPRWRCHFSKLSPEPFAVVKSFTFVKTQELHVFLSTLVFVSFLLYSYPHLSKAFSPRVSVPLYAAGSSDCFELDGCGTCLPCVLCFYVSLSVCPADVNLYSSKDLFFKIKHKENMPAAELSICDRLIWPKFYLMCNSVH